LQYCSTFQIFCYWIVLISTKNIFKKYIYIPDMLIWCNRFLPKYKIYHKQFLCLFLKARSVENVLQFITSNVYVQYNRLTEKQIVSKDALVYVFFLKQFFKITRKLVTYLSLCLLSKSICNTNRYSTSSSRSILRRRKRSAYVYTFNSVKH